jgi:hypothetical protein
MSNNNVLDGMRCPNCASEEPFYIEVTMMVTVYDGGTEQSKHSDTEWSDDAYAECVDCRWSGIVADLQVKNQEVAE